MPRYTYPSLEERVASGIDRSGGVHACWHWTRGTDGNGYGTISVGSRSSRRMFRVHRVAWEIEHGPIPEGICVLHHCDTPLCCNAVDTEHHLFLGTQQDNLVDMKQKGRKRVPSGDSHWKRRPK